MEIYKNNFSFHATRYEEWMNGQCLRNGNIEVEIAAESTATDIRFYISDTGSLNINDSSIFEFTDETYELVLDRIIYYHETDSPESNEPVECQLFRDGATISCIRFTMSNPLRVIEFYGNVIEIGQPKRHIYKESNEIKTAEYVLSHLKATCRYDADEIMEAAMKHFELYCDAASHEQIRGIVESLKLFVEVYKLLIEQTYDEGRTHLLLPKVCFFISICNLKICNIEQAYAVAKEGLIKVNAALSESIFENLPPEVLGADDLKRVITDIENNYPQVLLSNNSNIVNPCIVDTRIIDSIEKNEHHSDGVIAKDSEFIHHNIPAIFIRRSRRSIQTYESGSIAIELPDIFVFKSNEHQRYEYESPVMGLQKCLRTIVVEANKNGCEGYKIKPGDGYVVKIYNNDTSNAQMSAKPMRLVQVTDSFIELRGYPLLAWSLFGWQPLDYSEYGFFIHYANGRITHCDLHMFDRNVRIEYRYTNPNIAQFDNWPMFQDFSFQEFHFPVDRYEEWEAGRIVASGEVHFNIRFKYNTGGLFSRKTSIDVQLDNNPMPQKIISSVKFDRATTNGERIMFYIAAEQTNVQNTALLMLSSMLGYTRDYKYYDSNEPIFASVFTINHNVAKVSFSFGNPDRLIEFF